MIMYAWAKCPGCTKQAQFWSVRHEKTPKTDEANPVAIYMYPANINHYPVPEFAPDIPEQLQRAFVSTIEAFNSRNYAATAVCSRRTLEGIFKHLVTSPKNSSLADLIKKAEGQVDLSAPLKNLSHAIRNGGNLGAHFDMEKEPDDVMARQMVELLDYLISYLYVLPKKIKQLEEELGRSRDTD